ncbi:sugar ABC transporter ATP-binding protein [Hoeflea sp. Naph1]|uniref:sugar ABC transporter ATP-binding protein n=1 Tax=Hoeflea sp. Naph1 TaxID=3388653 RepID=UPI00398FDA91
MPMLEVTNLSKQYSGVAALTDVTFAAEAGEIHAIIGANGAGKSTLMNLLSGVTPPSGGSIMLAGESVRFASPQAAQAAGVATVYQEFSLVPQLSVARNIFLGREPRTRLGLIDPARLTADTQALLERFSIELDPSAEVSSLSVAQQQMVEIARALTYASRILILDEPTAVLSLTEQKNLFAIMRRLRTDGLLILFVSHRLEEVLSISDRITVIRDGRKIDTRPTPGLTIADIVSLMIGRTQNATPAPHFAPEDAERYTIDYTTSRGAQRIDIRRGEILGLAGLVGAGRTSFARALAGNPGPGVTVEARIDGAPLSLKTPHEAMRSGVVYLTEDRKRDGIFASLDLVANATAAALPGIARCGIRNHRAELARSRAMLEQLRLVASGLTIPISKLSGGNQQKVVLARALLTRPQLLICDEPTRGVDVGAKSEIHDILRALAAQGTAVLVISSESEELLALSHRILTMHDRRFVAEMPIDQASELDILLAASGGTPAKEFS